MAGGQLQTKLKLDNSFCTVQTNGRPIIYSYPRQGASRRGILEDESAQTKIPAASWVIRRQSSDIVQAEYRNIDISLILIPKKVF